MPGCRGRSPDLRQHGRELQQPRVGAILQQPERAVRPLLHFTNASAHVVARRFARLHAIELDTDQRLRRKPADEPVAAEVRRSEEHTSELQSLMSISYAVFCLKKKK